MLEDKATPISEENVINISDKDMCGNPIEDSPCLLEILRKEELKKPEWLRSHGFMIVCKCKRCRRYMG